MKIHFSLECENRNKTRTERSQLKHAFDECRIKEEEFSLMTRVLDMIERKLPEGRGGYAPNGKMKNVIICFDRVMHVDGVKAEALVTLSYEEGQSTGTFDSSMDDISLAMEFGTMMSRIDWSVR